MNYNKIGKLFIGLGLLFLITLAFLEFIPFHQFHHTAGWVSVLLVSLFLLFVAGGMTLSYLHSAPLVRSKAIKTLSLICGFIFLFGVFGKLMHYPGASLEIFVSIVFFSFSAVPLIILNRYEKRKSIMSQRQLFQSIFDLCVIIILLFSFLARIFHWPFAQELGVLGFLGLVFSFWNWNRSFKKEVLLRKEAENNVKAALSMLEEKNKEILDSITYAQRIQKALLASESLLKRHLGEHFFLYQPKDIVSGDFYWACLAHERFYLSVADSTGHGVPGAFMSILNISYLNEAINEKNISSPDAVLSQVRTNLIHHLNAEGLNEGGNDGMDCVLMCFDFKKKRLEFACANNPLLLVRDGKLQEFEADKIPVGKSARNDSPFRLQHLELKSGDVLYVFTDGMQDQFGGPKGKKLKYKHLCEQLLKQHGLSMDKQKEALLELFKGWKGGLEQVDDILIAGIRIP